MNSLAWKPSNKTLSARKYESKIAEKVKYLNFYPHRWLFWIPSFFGGGTLVFELFSIFSLKMGSKGIKTPIYPVIMMIQNYDPL